MNINQKDIINIVENKEHYLLDKVFIKDTSFQFIFKKTEKIITAIYLVTNFFDPQEPLKWSLRNSLNNLLKTLTDFGQSPLSDKEKNFYNLNSALLKISSSFDLAYYSGFISQMNYEIINFEISKLAANIDDYYNGTISSNKGLFDTDYFKVESFINLKDRNPNHFQKDNFNQTNQKDTQNETYQDDKYIKDTFQKSNLSNFINPDIQTFNQNRKSQGQNISRTKFSKGQNPVQPKKTKNKKDSSLRQQRILEEIKRQGNVSVKDISKLIRDCSEKTLQRDLIDLIDQGQIIKKGERRWSKYFPANQA